MANKKIIKPGMKPPAGQQPPRPAKSEGRPSKTQGGGTHDSKNNSVNHGRYR